SRMSDLILWTANGAGLPEVRSRLAERTDEECAKARTILIREGRVDRRGMRQLALLCDASRNVGRILAGVEEMFAEQTAKADGEPVEPYVVELCALMIEGLVRHANRLDPR